MERTEWKKLKKLQINQFVFETTVGEGSCGKVRILRRKKDGAVMCAKVMKKSQIIESKTTNHIINQCHIISQIDHPFIVQFKGISQDSKFIYLFMEYVPGGELFNYLKNQQAFSPHQARFYASQILLTLEHLHGRDIIYRDLKPENILIAKDGYIKLSDFGFAKKVPNRTFTLCGTPQYLAPEVILNKGHGKPVDWWTFGVLLYEMIAGFNPFSDKDPVSIFYNILKCNFEFPRKFDRNARSLIKHLLVQDLSKRYGNLKEGINDIKNHRFFHPINFQDICQKQVNAPYIPTIKKQDDTSNFLKIEETNSQTCEISPNQDPFLEWSS